MQTSFEQLKKTKLKAMNFPRLVFLLLSILSASFAAIPFLPGLNGPFIFDDIPNITSNYSLHISKLSFENLLYATYSFQPGHGSRPLSMLTFALDFWRGNGLNPHVFKTTNLVVHVLTTIAIALFIRQLASFGNNDVKNSTWIALFVAVAWAVHPMQVSTVMYVVQRMQILSTLFIVLALWSYLRMRRSQLSGTSWRQDGFKTLFFSVLGFAAKEDAILLPLLTLTLELTVLRFRARDHSTSSLLRKTYLCFVVVGATTYLVFVIPHYWSWTAYPGRDFNSWERVLTQSRVLVMYLGQIIAPLPSSFPFYYDDFRVSRSLLNPSDTFFAGALISALLITAWSVRKKRPLISAGIMLFFAGHFLTSNIVNLELAFEHRNNFPLIGAIVAIVDALFWIRGKYKCATIYVCALLTAGILSCVLLTYSRSKIWGNSEELSLKFVQYAPRSERAWLQLAGIYAEKAGTDVGSPFLLQAIALSEEGVEATGSLPLLSNIVVNKSLIGTVTRNDWVNYLNRLRQVPMSVQNRNTVWTLLANAELPNPHIDKEKVRESIKILALRWNLSYQEEIRFGAFIHNETRHPDEAFPYFVRAVQKAPKKNPDIDRMLVELREADQGEWADQLERLRQ